MTPSTSDLKKQLKSLTDWWAGTGVSVDVRVIERALNGLSKVQADPPVQTAQIASGRSHTHVQQAQALARQSKTLADLETALKSFEGSDLKQQASHTVFADGTPNGDVLVLGEGPGREDDQQGKPFVGPAGQLLDRMLASIGLSKAENTLVAHVNFWRPPGNRNPTDAELLLCRPFVDRLIELSEPKVIIATGAIPTKALLGTADGIMKLRGQSLPFTSNTMTASVPVFPIFHPAYLLRRPAEKARAWADLLRISTELERIGIESNTRP